MSNTIDITFIIPVANKAPVLPYVMENLKRQKGHFVAEYIFIDDNSDDNSVEIIHQTAKKLRLSNVQVIENKEKKGLSVRVNQGIAKAIGDFIFFMDAGDILALDAIHHMYERMIISGADMARGMFEISSKEPSELIDFELKSPVSAFVSTHPLGTVLTQKHIKRLGILARADTVMESAGADTSLYMDDISLTLNLAQVSKKMIVITQPIFRISSHFPLYRTDPKNQSKIMHDVFLSYYRFIKFSKPNRDETDLALDHALEYGMRYVTDSSDNFKNILPKNRYSFYYFLAKTFPTLRPWAVKNFAEFIKNDKKRWQQKIDPYDIKIVPVTEDDIPLIKIYFIQTAKETDFLSTTESWFTDAAKLTRKYLLPEMNSIFVKATYRGDIIGLCLLKKYYLSNTYQLSVSVMSQFWDRGIGTSLIKTTLKIAKSRDIKYINMYINVKDKRSISLFKKHGFVAQDKITETLGEDKKKYKAYLMQKEL